MMAKQYSEAPPMVLIPNARYDAQIQTSEGYIDIHLLADEAPATVNNFVFLAREGFYDGVPFHRVINGFMIQTGDPTGTGRGGPGYKFADEPVQRRYTPGTVAMANAGPNTNGSQFFIVHGNDAGLPPNYTIFGQVVAGMDTVDKIAQTPVKAGASGERSTPVTLPRIESVKIEESGEG